MYRVRLLIDKRTWYRRNLDNPNAWKGILWHLFEQHNLPYDSGGWVFRVDTNGEKFNICVISKFSPNIGALQCEGIQVIAGEISEDVFLKGNRYPFRARINPVTRSNGKRVPKDIKEIPAWLAKQFDGAAKCICIVENVGVQFSYKNGERLTHNSVDVRGLLEVIDNKAFVNVLTSGVGHAKRYGFGLIGLNV